MKIALIGAFNLADGYLGAAKALRKLGNDVVFVPAYLYNNDIGKQKHHMAIIDHLLIEKPDVCLWWRAETLDAMQFMKIRKIIKSKFIMYSWDDPLQWERHAEMPLKCKCLDAAFSCCMDSVEMYKQNGVPIVEWCPPGFDPEVHFPEEDENYKCDLSLVCTNLYHEDPITHYDHISRKDLVDAILKRIPDIDFRLYGPESFGNIYPKHYKGWISFNDSHKVFNNSKINLCSHIRPDGNMYINERVCQIMGSKGLLLVDKVKGIEEVINSKDGKELHNCILYSDVEDCVNKVEAMLDHNKRPMIDRGGNEYPFKYSEGLWIAGRGWEFAKENLTWDNWSKKIMEF